MPGRRARLLAQLGLGVSQPRPIYISKQELSARWRCSEETLKYYRKKGILHPISSAQDSSSFLWLKSKRSSERPP
jgi:hypothetical protein